MNKALEKHSHDAPHGGMEALLPSLIGVSILACGLLAKMGFRGRASVASIDLGKIQCISDPATHLPIVPSVVSFLEPRCTGDQESAFIAEIWRESQKSGEQTYICK